jgi:hypothetical protein
MASSGCLPSLSTAPFPASADTTEAGTLLGPFEGRATDATSGRPIPGALVWVSWRFCDGTGMCVPAGTETWSGETDADGHYWVPRLAHFPGAVRLDGVTLFVYKRGYIAYRSDRYYDEHARGNAQPRRDFAQTRNAVALERFPDGGSHAMHLAFVGGSGALRAALRAEALQASLDEAHAPAAAAPLDATALFTVEELRQITGTTDEMVTERLTDLPRTPRYDSAHFRARDRSDEAYDAAYRVTIYDSAAEADAGYEALLGELPNPQALEPVPTGLGARAARGHDGDLEGGITGLLVLDRAQKTTVLFTCGNSLCRHTDEIDAIARKVVSRLPHIVHPAPETKKPAPKEPPQPQPAHEEFKLREPGLHR